MNIVYQEESGIFHLYNDRISYLMMGLPATYTENPEERMTLKVCPEDEVTNIRLELLYTVFESGALARSAKIVNAGDRPLCTGDFDSRVFVLTATETAL